MHIMNIQEKITHGKMILLKEQTHITKDDIRSAEAPYLIFKLGEQRELNRYSI